MHSPRILYLSVLALSTLTAYALPIDQSIKTRQVADTSDADENTVATLNQAVGFPWTLNDPACEGEGCSNLAIKAREEDDNDFVRTALDSKGDGGDGHGGLGGAGALGWSMNSETVCEGEGCPPDHAIKARDDDDNGGPEDVDKDQLGGVFWEIKSDVICEGEGC